MAAVFLLDTQFVIDVSKFFSGALVALSTMIRLEVHSNLVMRHLLVDVFLQIPCVNVLTKCDLLTENQRERLEEWLEPNNIVMLEMSNDFDFHGTPVWRKQRRRLTKTIAELVRFLYWLLRLKGRSLYSWTTTASCSSHYLMQATSKT